MGCIRRQHTGVIGHHFPLAAPHHTSVILSEPSDVDLCLQRISESEYLLQLAGFFLVVSPGKNV